MANGFNFAKRPFTNERLPRLVVAAATAAVVAVTVLHAILLTRSLLREQEELDSRVEVARAELQSTEAKIREARSTLAQKRTALGDERTQFLTRLYRRKSFAWTELFNELEKITPAPVRVTAISPTEDEGRITVTLNVVGKTLEDVLEMVRRLEASSFFTTVYPLDESALDARSGDTGIAATLELQYVEPATRVEASPPPALPAAAPAEDDETAPEGAPAQQAPPATDAPKEASS